MATRQQALRAIELAGGTVDWNVSSFRGTEKVITVDAPSGYCWDSSGAECFCISWYSGPASEFWDEVIERVQFGVAVL
ncbi:MAG: hypothetical protein CMA63_02505 [Euryarchaeota archaeon]|nr:hypothetical protein [Euryarchaeota archaeon]|tara:strand:- start:1169 stop:1402 length:234 start_codon:yes stop_codon:yes gene_type:complete